MRHGHFIMFDDDDLEVTVHSARGSSSRPTAYHPARFPTKNISSPILLMYGDTDSLIDINVMMSQLPTNTVLVHRLHVSLSNS
jgi:lysosomal acid lipase/cholesteryl ester hydrolase